MRFNQQFLVSKTENLPKKVKRLKQFVDSETLQKIDNFLQQNSEFLKVSKQDSKNLILIQKFHSTFNNNWIHPLYQMNQTFFKFTSKSFSKFNLESFATGFFLTQDSDEKIRIHKNQVLKYFTDSDFHTFPNVPQVSTIIPFASDLKTNINASINNDEEYFLLNLQSIKIGDQFQFAGFFRFVDSSTGESISQDAYFTQIDNDFVFCQNRKPTILFSLPTKIASIHLLCTLHKIIEENRFSFAVNSIPIFNSDLSLIENISFPTNWNRVLASNFSQAVQDSISGKSNKFPIEVQCQISLKSILASESFSYVQWIPVENSNLILLPINPPVHLPVPIVSIYDISISAQTFTANSQTYFEVYISDSIDNFLSPKIQSALVSNYSSKFSQLEVSHIVQSGNEMNFPDVFNLYLYEKYTSSVHFLIKIFENNMKQSMQITKCIGVTIVPISSLNQFSRQKFTSYPIYPLDSIPSNLSDLNPSQKSGRIKFKFRLPSIFFPVSELDSIIISKSIDEIVLPKVQFSINQIENSFLELLNFSNPCTLR